MVHRGDISRDRNAVMSTSFLNDVSCNLKQGSAVDCERANKVTAEDEGDCLAAAQLNSNNTSHLF